MVDRPVDVVAYAPKPYTPVALGKQRLADALALLPPGGEFVLAASEQIGLARYERCLEEVTSAPVEHVAERDGCHLLSVIRPPSVSAPTHVDPSVLRPTVDGVTLSLMTVPGLFASSQLDDGTRLLLETATIDDGDRVLDLCCGYGAIGAYAGAVADCEVWLSDDDRVATRCAECSLRRSGVEGRVTTADCIEGTRGETFDRVLCNPPTHAGDDVLTELFEGIEELLAVGGRALLVHHRSLDLDAELSVFDEVQMIRMGPEHVVIEAVPDTVN